MMKLLFSAVLFFALLSSVSCDCLAYYSGATCTITEQCGTSSTLTSAVSDDGGSTQTGVFVDATTIGGYFSQSSGCTLVDYISTGTVACSIVSFTANTYSLATDVCSGTKICNGPATSPTTVHSITGFATGQSASPGLGTASTADCACNQGTTGTTPCAQATAGGTPGAFTSFRRGDKVYLNNLIEANKTSPAFFQRHPAIWTILGL